MKRTFLISICAVVLLGACNKDDDSSASTVFPPKSISGYLTSGSWHITGYQDTIWETTWGQGDTIVTDKYAQFRDCDKDNRLTFSQTRTFVQDNAPVLCDPTESPSQMGGWQILDDNKTINLNGVVFNPGEYDILQLDDSVFSMRYAFNDFSSSSWRTGIITMRH